MAAPLMPKATAVWLVENTSLTFDQIADFCQLHPLEIQAIADGEVANQMQGLDPVANGQTTVPSRSGSAAEALAKGPPAASLQAQGPALHADLQAAGQAGCDFFSPEDASRAVRHADHKADRHDKADDCRGARPYALEQP